MVLLGFVLIMLYDYTPRYLIGNLGYIIRTIFSVFIRGQREGIGRVIRDDPVGGVAECRIFMVGDVREEVRTHAEIRIIRQREVGIVAQLGIEALLVHFMIYVIHKIPLHARNAWGLLERIFNGL
jgi:hypothetical protein